MMGENPNYWWSLNGKPPPSDHIQQPSPTFMSPLPVAAPPPSLFHPQYLFGSSLLLPTNSNLADNHDHNQDFPLSWSQLLLGGLDSEEGQILNPSLRMPRPMTAGEVKQELDQTRHELICSTIYREDGINEDDDNGSQACSSSWSSQVDQLSSCDDTSTGGASKKAKFQASSTQTPLMCNGTFTSGASKKTRLQHSSTQPPLKVRKEKLGDRITALHQLVSPFGKTDTASVLLEATEHIRFLEGQIEALSSPYMKLGNASGSMRHQQSVIGEERSCIIPEQPAQVKFLNNDYLKRRGASKQDGDEDAANDLRSRGLCLVPVTCIDHIDNKINGSDYWTPALGGDFNIYTPIDH